MYADLSPYEIARLKNIQENKKKLEEFRVSVKCSAE